jgi:uncharacterized protein YggT (Ycf19 family)
MILIDTKFMNEIVAYSLLLLTDIVGYCYILLKVYRIICFSKVTLDQLPLINPYKWPFSFFRVLTQPYFRVCHSLIPSLKIGKVAYDVSTIVGLEALSSLIYMTMHIRVSIYSMAEILLEKVSS